MSMGQGGGLGQGAMQRRVMRPRPAGGALPPGAPGGPQPAVPMQQPGPPMGGPPQGLPQEGPPQMGGAPPPGPPVGDVRTGAMDQYRDALLRRMGGAIPEDPMGGAAPQSGPPMGEGGVPEMLGTPPGNMGGGAPDIGSIVKDLMQSRFSRRVLGRGPGQ